MMPILFILAYRYAIVQRNTDTALPLNSVGSILASMFCFVVVDALAKTVALAYSGTLIVILLAPLILKERWTGRAVAAALVGFCGVLLVVRPGGSQSSWFGPMLLLLSAFFGALSIVQIKRIRSTDDSATTVLFFTLVGMVVTGLTLVLNWRTPAVGALLITALLGAFATAGQVLMTTAFRQADAAKLAPYNYTSIVWAALFGYVVWGETLQPLSVVGIAVVVGSAIAVAVGRKDKEGPLA